jgi:hypothetical protein
LYFSVTIIGFVLAFYLAKYNMPIPVWTPEAGCRIVRYPVHQVFAVSFKRNDTFSLKLFFIAPHLLWHETSGFAVSSEGLSNFIAAHFLPNFEKTQN